jgi:hypothetical protein
VSFETTAFYSFLVAGYLVRAGAFLAAVAVVLRRRVGRDRVRLLAAAAGILLAGEIASLFPFIGYDYHIFWQVGRDVWQDLDPYAPEHFPFLYPPSALPVCAVFALLPYPISFPLWTGVNVLALLALVVLAQRVLQPSEHVAGQPGPGENAARGLPAWVVMVLTVAVAVSEPSRATLDTGQLSILVAALLLLSLQAQAGGRPLMAGLALALASVKPATALPFLLLFHRKADGKTWLSLGGIVLCLCLVSGSPVRLLPRLAVLRGHVDTLASPGQVNDYSFAGPRSETIVAFDHALYRLGLRDRALIRACQSFLLLALGGWVLYQVLGGCRLPRPAACSLVALYATLFLYHRTYDLVLLVLPLVYSSGQARSLTAGARRAFAACAVCILVTLFVKIDWLIALQRASLGWGTWGRIVQAVLLPCATWLILFAMAFLVMGARRCSGRPDCLAKQTGRTAGVHFRLQEPARNGPGA